VSLASDCIGGCGNGWMGRGYDRRHHNCLMANEKEIVS
jgi:hypothetical protein